MRASSIMTSPVITVGPETPVPDIAALLFKNRISAVPVIEEGRLVGLLSQSDLLHRHELGTDRPARAGSWWLRLFSEDRLPAAMPPAWRPKTSLGCMASTIAAACFNRCPCR